MVLMFELYLLRGEVTPADRVVGWGVFPIADSGLSVQHGGKVDLHMTNRIQRHFGQVQDGPCAGHRAAQFHAVPPTGALLCNRHRSLAGKSVCTRRCKLMPHHSVACRYFEVVKLPRYVSGQKEFEVELQYTSGLLGENRMH